MIIGIYDSGAGGLSVWRELRDKTGLELIYFGDIAHMPYGEKTAAQLESYFWRITEFFISKGAQGIVAACNTSSALVLPQISAISPVPVIGVIDSALQAVLPVSRGRIGLLATRATVNSGAYQRALGLLRPDWQIFAQSAPRLVPLVEEGKIEGGEAEKALREYLRPLLEKEIDTLLLGCTHYPFLLPLLERIAGPEVAIVDPAHSVGCAVSEWLRGLGGQEGSSKKGRTEFWSSARPEEFRRLAEKLLGAEIPPVGLYKLPEGGPDANGQKGMAR